MRMKADFMADGIVVVVIAVAVDLGVFWLLFPPSGLALYTCILGNSVSYSNPKIAKVVFFSV
jgi:hypothetical protein